jgi:hypothetical protein
MYVSISTQEREKGERKRCDDLYLAIHLCLFVAKRDGIFKLLGINIFYASWDWGEIQKG